MPRSDFDRETDLLAQNFALSAREKRQLKRIAKLWKASTAQAMMAFYAQFKKLKRNTKVYATVFAYCSANNFADLDPREVFKWVLSCYKLGASDAPYVEQLLEMELSLELSDYETTDMFADALPEGLTNVPLLVQAAASYEHILEYGWLEGMDAVVFMSRW